MFELLDEFLEKHVTAASDYAKKSLFKRDLSFDSAKIFNSVNDNIPFLADCHLIDAVIEKEKAKLENAKAINQIDLQKELSEQVLCVKRTLRSDYDDARKYVNNEFVCYLREKHFGFSDDVFEIVYNKAIRDVKVIDFVEIEKRFVELGEFAIEIIEVE